MGKQLNESFIIINSRRTQDETLNIPQQMRKENPFTYPETKQIVKIEKGKITKAIKKTKYAGRIELRIISKDGTQVNPGQLFGENADIRVRICGKSLLRCMGGIKFTKSGRYFLYQKAKETHTTYSGQFAH